MTGMLTKGSKEAGELLVKSVAKRIARDSPKLKELSPEDLEKLARVVVAESLKDDLRRAADLERIDYPTERDQFIERASRTGSARTRDLYRRALLRLEGWCKAQGLSPLELSPARADDWIADLRAQGRAPATVNVDVAAASSFWTWMERRHTELRNPFRGTRARPARKATRKLAIPTEKELAVLEEAADPVLRAAIAVMAHAGLRVGALPSLSILGSRWTATTKGKEQSGTVPDSVRKAIERAELPLRSPFADLSATQILDRFRYLVRRMLAEAKVSNRYSVHDLRHAFAVRLYRASHDVYEVEKALGHANVAVTETYLRSLGLE